MTVARTLMHAVIGGGLSAGLGNLGGVTANLWPDRGAIVPILGVLSHRAVSNTVVGSIS
jgi:hypothetical protein